MKKKKKKKGKFWKNKVGKLQTQSCSKRIKPLNEPVGIVLGNFLIKNLNKNLMVKF